MLTDPPLLTIKRTWKRVDRRVLDALKQIGITHVVGLPDNSTAALFHELADDGGRWT